MHVFPGDGAPALCEPPAALLELAAPEQRCWTRLQRGKATLKHSTDWLSWHCRTPQAANALYDTATAAEFYRRAAAQGRVTALCRLGSSARGGPGRGARRCRGRQVLHNRCCLRFAIYAHWCPANRAGVAADAMRWGYAEVHWRSFNFRFALPFLTVCLFSLLKFEEAVDARSRCPQKQQERSPAATYRTWRPSCSRDSRQCLCHTSHASAGRRQVAQLPEGVHRVRVQTKQLKRRLRAIVSCVDRQCGSRT